MNILINWLISALAVLASAYLLPGVAVSNFVTALIAALVLGILNAFIKPLLLLLTLPINILTLGLFTLVINAGLIMLAANMVDGFTVDGFWWAVIFALVLSVVNSVFGGLTDK